jgi:anti-sigma B factor antagonist
VAELDDDMGARLEVERRSDSAGQPVIALAGDLDISSVDGLRSAVEQAAGERPERITFELSQLRFMDSAGIAVLLGAAREVNGVRLLNPTLPVRRVVELTGLGTVLEVEP